LALPSKWGLAIVPPRLSNHVLEEEEVLRAEPAMRTWLRTLLVLMAVLLIAVFATAIYLNPYGDDGSARRLETHLQLGLPECTFKMLTGKPCPSCGMTTSFALFVRGDLLNSLKANYVGTLLAMFCLLLVPYSLVSAFRRRYVLQVSLDWLMPRCIVIFVVLMLLRWAVVLSLGWP
jgi:Protein of unknown function (DUF2752)